MPPIKLSKVVYVPESPSDADPGDAGSVDLGHGPVPTLPGTRQAAIDKDVLAAFLDAIDDAGIPLQVALRRAIKQYTRKVRSAPDAPDPD